MARLRRRPYELNKEQRHRVDTTAQLLVDGSFGGWPDTIASRAVDCLDDKTWRRLFRGRKARDCKVLADTARALLDGKKQLRDATSRLTGRLAKAFGADPIEEAVVRELAKRIPFPVVDQKVPAIARGLQVIGIAICMGADRPLSRCQCFIDLSLEETKEQVKSMLARSINEWTSSSSPAIKAWVAAAPGSPGWWQA